MEIVAVLCALAVALAYIRRHPARVRAVVAALTHEARVRLGAYDLRELVLAAVQAVEARALPSVKTTYLPNRVVIGLHPGDADRFAGLLAEMADEVGAILAERARLRAGVTLVGGAVRVSVVRDPQARPGRPTVGARLARADAAATVPLEAA